MGGIGTARPDEPSRPAARAGTHLRGAANGDQRTSVVVDRRLHGETAWYQGGGTKGLSHDVDSLRETDARQRPNSIKSESEPIFPAD